jgi:hypothetical protein
MGKLRDQMLADLQLRGATPRTQKTYLREAGNLAKYFNRSPEELGEDELKEYMLCLTKERHLSEGTYRFYVAALKFLYRTTPKREWVVEKIKCPKRERKPPVVLAISEVESILSVTKNLKHKAMLMITYSSSRLRTFSVNTALHIKNPIGCPVIICGSCAPSRYAELLSSAAIRISATTAAIWKYRITPAGTGTAPNARPYRKKNGSRPVTRISFPLSISMWSLPSPRN